MIEFLHVILLGIIEGFTEFLPISSTGHLIVAARLFPVRDSLEGIFEIFIQLGAVLAVMLYYRRELAQQLASVRISNDNHTWQLWLRIGVAFFPSAALGLMFHRAINEWLFSPEVVAIAAIAGGLMFIGVERYLTVQPDEKLSVDNNPPTWQQAVIIGIWQVLALIPGMSRSGMSIIGAMMAGVDRKRATQFSFYLALPTLGGATIYTLLSNLASINRSDLLILFIGTVVSALVAWISIGWLLRYVGRNSFVAFGYYRIVLGIVILAFRFLS
jgi:undecaprenyl-diphosphatase